MTNKSYYWTIYRNVIFALIMREIKTIYGDSRLGYAWEIFSSFSTILVFWLIREFFKSYNYFSDIPTPVFILTAFSLWNIFSECSTKSIKAILGNKALLIYPQVQPLDIVIARSILITYTNIVSACVFFIIIIILGHKVTLFRPEYIVYSLLLTFFCGLGFGAILCSLDKFFPTVSVFFTIFNRILFFTSGVFFSLSELPQKTASILSYNPLAVIFDLHRSAYSNLISVNSSDIRYAAFFSLSILLFGLFVERMTRKKMPI